MTKINYLRFEFFPYFFAVLFGPVNTEMKKYLYFKNTMNNIFRHCCPCQFNVQDTTDINHNKASLLKQLSGMTVVRIL